MYTPSFLKSHLGIVTVDLLHQESATIVGVPFTAHVTGEVAKVSRMTNVPVNSWRSHLGIVAVDISHQKSARTLVDPVTAYVPG